MRSPSFLIVLVSMMLNSIATIAQSSPNYRTWLNCSVSWLIDSGDDIPQDPAKRVIVQEVLFDGVNKLPISELEGIATQLKSHPYNKDSGWLDDLNNVVHDAWERHGYFKVAVRSRFQELSANSPSLTVAVTMHIDEGEQYRLQDILFVNNQQFDSGQLRELFSISAGDLFNTHTIQEGLEKLRKLYGTRGFINLTAAPQVQVDETSGLISLTIDLEEGQQFRISEVTIKGDEGELKRFLRKRKVEPGQVFDGSFTEYMLISANVERKIDEKNATVALSIEILSPCAPPSDITL